MSWFVPAAAGLYLFFCLLYARRTAARAESLQKGVFCLVLSLALPGAGPLLLWFCDHCARRTKPADYAEFYRGSEFCPDDLRRLQTPDLRAETDRVPMEEALLVSDLSYRRGMVMHLLDEADPLACLPALRRALANEDSETSHYASVAIMELRRKLQQQLDEAEARWRKVPRDADACAAWEELLYNVMQTDLFDRDVRRRLMQRHTALTNQMLRGSHPSEACLHHRIKSVRPDPTLDLIGPCDEDPAYYEECRDLIRRLDCPDIRFVGRADVTRWLPELDLVLLTSISEGQPFVLLEAMAARRPVVATNVGACREIIEGADDGIGPAGRVVPVMSPAAIAEGVLDISRSPAQLRALAENGYRRVVRFYQDKDFLAAYRALYREAVQNENQEVSRPWQASALG